MSDNDLAANLGKRRAAVESIEARLLSGNLPPSGMDDLKSGVDELRLRIWATMSAANNPDALGTIERFRLRRAIETCDSIARGLADGQISARHSELGMLQKRAEGFLKVSVEAAANAH